MRTFNVGVLRRPVTSFKMSHQGTQRAAQFRIVHSLKSIFVDSTAVYALSLAALPPSISSQVIQFLFVTLKCLFKSQCSPTFHITYIPVIDQYMLKAVREESEPTATKPATSIANAAGPAVCRCGAALVLKGVSVLEG